LLAAVPLLVLATFAVVGSWVAMSSSFARAGPPLETAIDARSRQIAQAPTVPATSIVLLVDSTEAAERYRSLRRGGVAGSRGEFQISVAVIRTVADELLLRTMLLGNDAICPTGACGDLVIIDLRGSE
jgi:hypothetical protein